MPTPDAHRVVVVGGGFGGLHAVQKLKRLPVEVTLIDKRNFHLFQPLTYQVATGALSPGDIAYPLRSLFKRDENVRVVLGEVTDVDLDAREVLTAEGGPVPYDTLIMGAGSSYAYFGHDEWAEHALEVKTLESATAIRSRILRAFERAELEPDADERDALLTFVVVGGGPTGVEMAGQIAELAHDTLRREFWAIDPRAARIVLVDAGDRILQTFPESLSAKAARALERLGVELRLHTTVVGVDDTGVDLPHGRHIPARTVVWAAGVHASTLAAMLGETDRAGRVIVERDLTLPHHPEVIAIGDMVRVGDEVLPGVAPVAIQQGRHAARVVRSRLHGERPPVFRYRSKGNVATIGRGRAVADLGPVRLSGIGAWLVWIVVHLWYLVGFRNRLLVTVQWAISYLTHGRGARLITHPEAAKARV